MAAGSTPQPPKGVYRAKLSLPLREPFGPPGSADDFSNGSIDQLLGKLRVNHYFIKVMEQCQKESKPNTGVSRGTTTAKKMSENSPQRAKEYYYRTSVSAENWENRVPDTYKATSSSKLKKHYQTVSDAWGRGYTSSDEEETRIKRQTTARKETISQNGVPYLDLLEPESEELSESEEESETMSEGSSESDEVFVRSPKSMKLEQEGSNLPKNCYQSSLNQTLCPATQLSSGSMEELESEKQDVQSDLTSRIPAVRKRAQMLSHVMDMEEVWAEVPEKSTSNSSTTSGSRESPIQIS